MGKAQSLFCSRAHSPFCSSFSKQWTSFLGGVQERKWGHPRVAYVCASHPYLRPRPVRRPPPPPPPHCCSHGLPPSGEDAGWADDRGIVWRPQKPPLASRRRGNWHRRLREQEMSGGSACGAGSCSVSLALSGNRLPNYRAVPAALSSCQPRLGPLPSVLTVSPGLGHLLPLPEGRRQLPGERPALILPAPSVQLQVTFNPARPYREAMDRSHPQGPLHPQVTVQAEPCPGPPPLLATPSVQELR